MNLKQLAAVAELERAISACKQNGLDSWQIAMEFQNLLSSYATQQGFEVKVTVVKK